MSRKLCFILFVSSILFSWLGCHTQKQGITENKVIKDIPIISFEQDTLHLGSLIEGEKRSLVFNFTNTGTATLIIDLASACKCTSLNWPSEPIEPGGSGQVLVEFDSTGFRGDVTKTVDVIANTDPIVVEAFFTAHVEAK